MQRFYYLLHLQYLGFRYHGFQKQIDVKTIQHMLDRTIISVLKTDEFKTLGASRTDAMVSSHHHMTQLMVPFELDMDDFIKKLNRNLPQDIKALEIRPIEKSFNPISSPKIKEYHYYFCFGEKAHPFCAPFMTNILENLDIELMKLGAKTFEGEHNFIQYCFRGNENKQYNRVVLESSIEKNQDFHASFFPKNTYCYRIKGEGFMRNQIRIMMGALFGLGRHSLSIEEIKDSLASDNNATHPIAPVASASGLHLIGSEFI